MNTKIIPVILFSITTFAALNTGCSVLIDPCPGQSVCGNGCMPVGAVCCGNDYCDQGYVCGPNNTCLSNSVSSCLSYGEETCTNYDGIEDCAPLGASCCHDHTYCPVGTVCSAGGCVQ